GGHQVSFVVVEVDAVVVGQRVVGGVDARLVGGEVDQAVRAAHARLPLHPEFLLQGQDEGREDVEHQRATGDDQGAELRIHGRIHHDRTHAGAQAGGADLVGGGQGL